MDSEEKQTLMLNVIAVLLVITLIMSVLDIYIKSNVHDRNQDKIHCLAHSDDNLEYLCLMEKNNVLE